MSTPLAISIAIYATSLVFTLVSTWYETELEIVGEMNEETTSRVFEYILEVPKRPLLRFVVTAIARFQRITDVIRVVALATSLALIFF